MDGSEIQNYALGQTFTEMLLLGCEGMDPQREDTPTSHEQLETFLTLADFVMDDEQQPWSPSHRTVIK